eukprot:6175399-Pleurochrysis_carterae.AAC.2
MDTESISNLKLYANAHLHTHTLTRASTHTTRAITHARFPGDERQLERGTIIDSADGPMLRRAGSRTRLHFHIVSHARTKASHERIERVHGHVQALAHMHPQTMQHMRELMDERAHSELEMREMRFDAHILLCVPAYFLCR